MEIRPDIVWSDTPSDHFPILLQYETPTGDRGCERELVDENLLLNYEVREKIRDLTRKAYGEGRRNERKAKKWSRAMKYIYDYLLGLTKANRKKEKIELRRLKAKAQKIQKDISTLGPDARRVHSLKQAQTKFTRQCTQKRLSFRHLDKQKIAWIGLTTARPPFSCRIRPKQSKIGSMR